MSQTYKINHIEGEEIKHIYIFSSDQSVIEPEYEDSNGNPIFTADEMKNIQDNNIPVDIISSTQLHGDDTIGMIKKKIISALQLELSTKEIYLFGITTEKMNSTTLYKQLTHNETIPLSNELRLNEHSFDECSCKNLHESSSHVCSMNYVTSIPNHIYYTKKCLL